MEWENGWIIDKKSERFLFVMGGIHENEACDDKKTSNQQNWSISSKEPKLWSANWFRWLRR